MCARPRRVANADLMDAAIRVIAERGAEQTRLSDVATASGLAPATLVQRFGSREGLLEAVAAAFHHDVRAAFESGPGSSLANLAAALSRVAARRHLGFLVTRPAGAASWSLELRKQIAFSLISAVEQGELPQCDVAALARRLQLTFYGAALAAQLEGTALDVQVIAALIDEAAAGV